MIPIALAIALLHARDIMPLSVPLLLDNPEGKAANYRTGIEVRCKFKLL